MKGYWIGRVDVSNPDAYQELREGQCGPLRQVRRPLPGARRHVSVPSKAAHAPATW